jgi:hypothetical protein
MATIKTLTHCTFGVLSRANYKLILAEVHARELEKKIWELKSIPTLDKLSRKAM